MARSRMEKIGTIYTRTTGLLRSGAMKESEKPLWYDVYEAFPPKHEPKFDNPVEQKPIRKIFYPEDTIRAQFFMKYGSPGIISLSEIKPRTSLCEAFIQEYKRLEAEGIMDENQLMEDSALALESRGMYLDRSRMPVKPETEDDSESVTSTTPLSQPGSGKIRLADIFKENQDENK